MYRLLIIFCVIMCIFIGFCCFVNVFGLVWVSKRNWFIVWIILLVFVLSGVNMWFFLFNLFVILWMFIFIMLSGVLSLCVVFDVNCCFCLNVEFSCVNMVFNVVIIGLSLLGLWDNVMVEKLLFCWLVRSFDRCFNGDSF